MIAIRKRLSRTLQLLHVWGMQLFTYFALEYIVSIVLYSFAFKVTRRNQKLLIWFLCGLFGIIAFICVAQLVGHFASIGLLLLLGAFALAGRFMANRITLHRLAAHARHNMIHRRIDQTASLFTLWSTWPVDAALRNAVEAVREAHPQMEIVLGHFDKDGQLIAKFGSLPFLRPAPAETQSRNSRHDVDIVLLGDYVLVRKDFRGNRNAFIREWYNLEHLQGKANVPAVHSVNERACVLYKNLVLGRTLRDLLVDEGASILSCQTELDESLLKLSPNERLEAVWARGRHYFDKVVSEKFFAELEHQINVIHAQGIVKLSLTFGNVMIGTSDRKLWLIDFEKSVGSHSLGSLAFQYLRDQDRVKYNAIYDRDILTEHSVRTKINILSRSPGAWYAPIDFGRGLSVGHVWHIDSGTGRWKTINAFVLSTALHEKRILDLGSNNGLMPMLMLRSGAKEVIGLELSSDFLEQAALVKQIFEWRDLREYPFEIHNCDMREILTTDWGAFDMVTSFCSLYYLDKQDMGAVVRRASHIAPMMVVQANSSTRAEAPHQKAEKSSVPFLKNLLEQNGFERVEIHNHANHPRPILIGYRV